MCGQWAAVGFHVGRRRLASETPCGSCTGLASDMGEPAQQSIQVPVGARITRLRAGDGRLVILANGDIASVTNYSRGPLQCSVDVTLPPDADLSRMEQTLQ